MTKHWTVICLMLCFAAFCAPAEAEDEWLLPNIALRLSVQVSNPSDHPIATLATIDVTQARMTAPEFPGRLAFALLPGNEAGPQPGTFVPIQIDDLDRDGIADQVHFPVELAARETRHVDVYYSTTLADEVAWPKRVNAKHSYGYNREVAALESELIGYRTYGGFFLDFMGRSAGHNGLNNDMAGYVSIYRDLGAGRDVFHIGNTLGLGGVFLQRDGKVFQPPMNVPTYAHKPSPAMVPHYRVISQGPLRASIETTLEDWNIDGDIIRLGAVYSIDAGTSFVRCHVEAVPVRIQAGHEYEFGTGLRELSGGSVVSTAGQLVVTGRQNARDGDIGIGLFYDPAQYNSPATVRTKDGGNHGLVSRIKLAAGQEVRVDYAVAGAWRGSGINDLASHLGTVGQSSKMRVSVGDFRFSKTPHPEKVEAEAQ